MKTPNTKHPIDQVQSLAVGMLNNGATIRATADACLKAFAYRPSNSLITRWRDEAGIDVKPRYADKTEAAQITRFNRLMGLFNRRTVFAKR